MQLYRKYYWQPSSSCWPRHYISLHFQIFTSKASRFHEHFSKPTGCHRDRNKAAALCWKKWYFWDTNNRWQIGFGVPCWLPGSRKPGSLHSSAPASSVWSPPSYTARWCRHFWTPSLAAGTPPARHHRCYSICTHTQQAEARHVNNKVIQKHTEKDKTRACVCTKGWAVFEFNLVQIRIQLFWVICILLDSSVQQNTNYSNVFVYL